MESGGVMRSSDHPQRTPAYGACLMIGAMLLGTAVKVWLNVPRWVQVIGLVIALVAALVGFVMTFRDFMPPRR